MKNFIDTTTQQHYAFDDDVLVTEENGIYAFATANGLALSDLPGTLQPLSDEAAAPALSSLKAAKKIEINVWRRAAIGAGVSFGGHTYDSDEASRANLAGALSAFQAGVPVPAGFTWRTSDNQDVAMDLPTLAGLAGAMIDHVDAQYRHSWALKAQVDAATDTAGVDAVVW
jgi:hypothetical protein